ncbi:MAG: PQQ-binding-like beta-propeller repeat protein, partial [Mariniphaga sp.]|nr:PQQ-binding-like beta-propeller repeat protein [Mariniphaga sp.]
VMHILEVSPKFKEIGSPELGEEIYTTPAFADGRIYMSTGKYLYCFGK